MKALQKTLAIVALLFLISQTIRHAYMRWWEPRGSVLDKYDEPAKDQIAAATSLDELLRRYHSVRKQVDLAKERAKENRPKGSDSPTMFQNFQQLQQQNQTEPFKSEQDLRQAITEWESRSKEIHALRFYWLMGLSFLILGMVIYLKRNRWFGLSLLIAGFSEFIYWTSPTFIGATREFDKLLVNKLALSVVSLLLLIVAIWWLRIFSERGEQSTAS